MFDSGFQTEKSAPSPDSESCSASIYVCYPWLAALWALPWLKALGALAFVLVNEVTFSSG